MLRDMVDGLSSGKVTREEIMLEMSMIRFASLQLGNPAARVDFAQFARLVRGMIIEGGLLEERCGGSPEELRQGDDAGAGTLVGGTAKGSTVSALGPGAAGKPPTDGEIRAHFDRFDVAKSGSLSAAMTTTVALPSFRSPECASEDWLRNMIAIVSQPEQGGGGSGETQAPTALSSVLSESEIKELRDGMPKEVGNQRGWAA